MKGKNQYANACREVFPGATKPLTQSVLTRLLDLEIQEQCIKRNKNRSFSNLYQSIVGTTSNHVVISVVNVSTLPLFFAVILSSLAN
jgi:hypothetical protein